MSKVVKKAFKPIKKAWNSAKKFVKKHWKKIAIAAVAVAAIYTGGAALGAWGGASTGASGAASGAAAAGAAGTAGTTTAIAGSMGTAMGTAAQTAAVGAVAGGSTVTAAGAGTLAAAGAGAAAGSTVGASAPSAIGTGYGGVAQGGMASNVGGAAATTATAAPSMTTAAALQSGNYLTAAKSAGNGLLSAGKSGMAWAEANPMLATTLASTGANAYGDYAEKRDMEKQAQEERDAMTWYGMNGKGQVGAAPAGGSNSGLLRVHSPVSRRPQTIDDLIAQSRGG